MASEHGPEQAGAQAGEAAGREDRGAPGALPRQRRGTTPQMHGRYPDYDVLASSGHWDELTRRLVLERLAPVPELRFFSESEARVLRAFCDVVMAQDAEPRIPVLEMIDAKLHAGTLDGFRYENMPPDPETWRAVAAGLDASARERGCDEGFATADGQLQHQIVGCFSSGELNWELPVKRAFKVVMRGVLSAFYSHPWAWNEIGFGGPAYPRGYARLGPGQREHWESPPQFTVDPVSDVRERRVE